MPAGLVSVSIAQVDAVLNYVPRTLRVDKTLNQRSRCEFQVILREGVDTIPVPVPGVVIDAYYNDVHLFGGMAMDIATKVHRAPDGEPNRVRYTIQAVDFTVYLERFFARRFFRNMLAGDIVTALLEEEIPLDIIGTDDIQDGILVSEFDATDFRSIGECVNDLATRCGYIWYITPQRTLYFGPRETLAAPFDISDSSDSLIYRHSFETRTSLENYANNVILVGGLQPSEPLTETFNGDLFTRTFEVAAEMFEAPQIQVDGVAQTVAEDEEANPDAQWYWTRSGTTIRQNDMYPPIDYLQVVTVSYSTSVQLVSGGEDADAIAERAGVENSGGRWQIVERDDLITTAEAATERISGLLQQLGQIPTTVTYETDAEGLDVGQLQSIQRSEHGLPGAGFIIDEISMWDEGAGKVLRKRIKATSGAHQEGAVEFFRALADKSTPKPTAGQYTTLVFFLAYQSGTTVTSPIVARDVPGARTITKAGYLGNARIWCHSNKPTTQSVKVDIRMNGTSIFNGTDYLEYKTTDSNTIYKYTFATQLVPVGAIFTAHVIQGDTTAANCTVELEVRH